VVGITKLKESKHKGPKAHGVIKNK